MTANDGTRLAEAESEPFTMANKAPTVTILTPQDRLEVRYGTTINVEAEVEDLQGDIPESDMEWYVNGAATSVTGSSYTAYLLPVGSNQISLRATNSAGQSTEESMTIIVNDDLSYPGPMLAVGADQLGWQLAEGQKAARKASKPPSPSAIWVRAAFHGQPAKRLIGSPSAAQAATAPTH